MVSESPEDAESSGRIVHKTGINGDLDRDYSIINRVRSIDKTNDQFMKRTRSVSRTRRADPSVTKTIPVTRKESANWSERGTQASIGGVLGIVRNRSVSRNPDGRSRSKARGDQESDDRDDNGKKKSLRSRSASRTREIAKSAYKAIRGKKKKKDKDGGASRGRTKDTRDDGTPIRRDKLPPMAPGSTRPPRPGDDLPPKPTAPAEEPEPEPEPKPDFEIDKLMAERNLIAEVEAQMEGQEEEGGGGGREGRTNDIDRLSDHDIMQLDETNTTMHVACLLHHSSSAIIERLDEDNSLAGVRNLADETPLHYAAMDKKGVSKDVLKRLLQLNPEAVKQPNVQNSLPIHLACMVGAPSTYFIKTVLKMYPKATMVQTDFPLIFEEDMVDTTKGSDDSDDDSLDSEFVSYTPKRNHTAVSGIASMFACSAPNQAAIEMANERSERRERSRNNDGDDGPQMETGFSPLHLAVMNSASPKVVDLLIRTNPRSVHLKTSRGRTALDCAQYIVRQHWLYGGDDEEDVVQNTFGAIELLEEAISGGDDNA